MTLKWSSHLRPSLGQGQRILLGQEQDQQHSLQDLNLALHLQGLIRQGNPPQKPSESHQEETPHREPVHNQ